MEAAAGSVGATAREVAAAGDYFALLPGDMARRAFVESILCKRY